jgi:hypothetical protein
MMDRVKWSGLARRWVPDPSGITLDEARGHGVVGLPGRFVPRLFVVLEDDPIAPDAITKVDALIMAPILGQLLALVADRKSTKEARRERRLALSRERSRKWFASVGKAQRAAKRASI